MVKIIKKALGIFFSHLQAKTNCNVSEKSNERFPRKSLADVRTDERKYIHTYGQMRLLRSQRPVGRETKKKNKIGQYIAFQKTVAGAEKS